MEGVHTLCCIQILKYSSICTYDTTCDIRNLIVVFISTLYCFKLEPVNVLINYKCLDHNVCQISRTFSSNFIAVCVKEVLKMLCRKNSLAL